MRRFVYELIEKAEHENQLSKWYDRFMIFCILLSIFPLCFHTTTPVFIFLDRVTVVIFIVDYILRWWTADYKLHEGKKSFLQYPFTPFAIIDLVTIFSSVTTLHSGLRLLRVLRLQKSLRALKLLRYSKGFHLMVRVFQKEKGNLMTIFYLVVGYILLSALVIFQVEPEVFTTYFDAVYWATITLTTIGYGDFIPLTYIGKAVAILSSFVGIAVFALPTGIITAGYMTELNQPKRKK